MKYVVMLWRTEGNDTTYREEQIHFWIDIEGKVEPKGWAIKCKEVR
jgi:hypothetical protein